MLLRGPALPASPKAVAQVLHEAGYQAEPLPTRPHPQPERSFERAKPNQLWQTDLFAAHARDEGRLSKWESCICMPAPPLADGLSSPAPRQDDFFARHHESIILRCGLFGLPLLSPPVPQRPSENPSQAAANVASHSGTSLSLLERARGRDEDAWRQLVSLYSPLVVSWCQKSGLGPAECNDILQDVFGAVASHLADFRRDRSGGTFRGWLRVITRNKIRDYFRKHADEPQGQGGSTARACLEEVADPLGDSPADDPEKDAEVSAVFARALELVRSEFEHKTWQAFWQAAVEGRPAADIATDLHITPGAVRQAKYKVLRRFRQELGEVVDWPEQRE
jgi:RNA polymerase sigma-70 factor (ECF subfamily)